MTSYLLWLSKSVEVIVIDSSPPDVFVAHAAQWNSFTVHIPLDPDISVLNGKVRGVLTGLWYAKCEKLIIADDDVRYAQRVRQAHDELARPWCFVLLLSLLPFTLVLILLRCWTAFTAGILAVIGLAELGRRKNGGRKVFPFVASLLAPVWLVERAVCTWFALGARLYLGGIPYHGSIITLVATPMKELRQRYNKVRITPLHTKRTLLSCPTKQLRHQ